MKILKQNAGIDIAKDSFAVSLVVLKENLESERLIYSEFTNDSKGIESFYSWAKKHKKPNVEMHYTMEATGVYHESLAYYLYHRQEQVHILLPTRVKKFIDSTVGKSKTDKIDSELIGRMGLERKLANFKLGSPLVRQIRKLTRERKSLVDEKTVIKNQLHAEQHSANKLSSSIERMQNRIAYIEEQIKLVEAEAALLIKEDDFLARKIKLMTSIPGVGFVTAATVIAETQGFSNINSIKQLSSYAGYDVKQRESGKYKGKTRISKQGNSHIRQILYMPAISSISHDKAIRNFYDRVNKNKASTLIGLTAVQRKLLGLMYTLWKKDMKYDKNYLLNAV